MNERIYNLIKQSEVSISSTRHFNGHIDINMFAQLIVQECAKVADRADENKCEWIGGNILTHFGVEQ
jgi:hypothetical protein